MDERKGGGGLPQWRSSRQPAPGTAPSLPDGKTVKPVIPPDEQIKVCDTLGVQAEGVKRGRGRLLQNSPTVAPRAAEMDSYKSHAEPAVRPAPDFRSGAADARPARALNPMTPR